MDPPPDRGPRDPRPYDPRRNPRRGVRVKPLPRSMHREFRRFCADLAVLARSHQSTWRLARRDAADEPIVDANLIYWESVIKFLSYLEYLGTTNDTREPTR